MDEQDTTPEKEPGEVGTWWPQRGLTPEQYAYLLNPLRRSRIASRRQGGKNLSYLEAWDVKAHLTRIFGFGNWDSEVVDYGYVATREYMSDPSEEQRKAGKHPVEMVEVIYRARVQLTVRDQYGNPLCRHSEVAVGSTSGPANMLGEHHDNSVKTAASDALKRCAINLGTQFGLSLYDNGNTSDVIRQTLVKPDGYQAPEPTAEDQAAVAAIEERIGAVQPTEAVATASGQEVDPSVSDPAATVPGVVETANPPGEPVTDEPPAQQQGVLAKAVSRSQAVDQVRVRTNALTAEQQDELRTWWVSEKLPARAKLTEAQAPIVLARIDLIEKQALVAEKLGATPVQEGASA